MRRILPSVLAWLVFVYAPAGAQTLGTITGEVKDASGAIIPGATVTATNTGTNAAREMPSNGAGVYTFAALPPGPYVVKAELQGFKTAQQPIELHVEQTVRVNFTMEVGELAESMVVSAVAPLITTENATVGTVIENRRIVELPLNGRNFLSLIALSTNVTSEFAGAGQAGDRQGGTRANQNFSIAGQRREYNYYTLDGTDNTDVNFNTYILLPSVDALEEFKVQTGIYSAEFGRAASQVNVVTKSGTNAFHGSIFEFLRNDAMDSRPYSFSAAQAALPKPPFSWNQYGYTLGGPIWRNKVFFMSNWEGYRDRKQFQQNYNVPRNEWRTGDFSSYSGVLYDPATCTVASASGVRTCQAFPGNQIPANRIHKTSKQLLEFYPAPTAAGTDASGTVNNYTAIQDRVIDKDQFTQRFDFVQNSASTWMGRYSHSRDSEISPALAQNGTKLNNKIHQAMLGNTRTLSPTVVNEFRFGYNSFYNTFGRELANVRDVTSELAIPGMASIPGDAWGIPSITINGLSGFGDSTEGPYTVDNKMFEFIDNVSWIKGRHSFKAGAHLRSDQYNQVGNQFPRGGFQFDGRATGSLNSNAIPIAPAFADFLLGYQRLSELSVQLAVTEFRAVSQSYYFTDTWRMRDNMTLDLGIRYEYVPPFEDKAGTLINASMPFFDQGLPVADMSRHPTLVRIGEGDFYENFNIRFAPSMQTARDGRLGNRLVNDDKLNLAPRVGWAWTPASNTSIRAGVGMFYMQDTGNPRFDMARNAAGRRQDTSDQFFNLNWNTPFAGSGSANACGTQPPIVCVPLHYVLGNDVERKTPRMLQYLFNVQREIGGNTGIEIGYLGSRSSELERMFDRNEVIPGLGSTQDRRPYPEFTRVQTIGNVAEARYNSLSAKLTRRMSNGFAALIGYTFAKSTDSGSGIRTLNGDALFPQNSNCAADEVSSGCEWGLSVFDVRHRIGSSIIYELPFGDGKKYLQGGVGGAILGGWQITNILSLASGSARDPNTGTDRAGTGSTNRPNLVSGQDPNDGPNTIQQWFNTAAFVQQPTGTYGDSVRNSIVGPGIFNFDMSIIRNFGLGGGKSLQLRLEAFNTFNQAVWNDPNTNVANSQYGQITSTRKPMRELQLGIKFGF
ncbi:MAG: carboxypeptidase-like regulatory domain-containing protein [Vicinamibacterales bacterium]|nr:carboxypeptidase-like regulatory domain-containing protein [Vicinamibacterales bacterium]